MRFYAEQATRGHHPQDIVESDPAAVSSCVEPEQSFEPPRDQPRAATSTVVESEPAAVSSCEPEQSFEQPRDQPRAATSTVVESEPAAVSSCVEPEQSFEPPHDQPQDVVSAIIETKRFYGGSKPKRPLVAEKLDVGLTSDS